MMKGTLIIVINFLFTHSAFSQKLESWKEWCDITRIDTFQSRFDPNKLQRIRGYSCEKLKFDFLCDSSGNRRTVAYYLDSLELKLEFASCEFLPSLVQVKHAFDTIGFTMTFNESIGLTSYQDGTDLSSPNGRLIVYNTEGNIAVRGFYTNGTFVGPEYEYDFQGNIHSIKYLSPGRSDMVNQTDFNSSGQIIYTQQCLADGTVLTTNYDDTGFMVDRKSLKGRDGIESKFLKNGTENRMI